MPLCSVSVRTMASTPIDAAESELRITAVGGAGDAGLVTVSHVGKGEYDVGYIVTHGPTCAISVTLRDEHIPGSLFDVPVVAGEAYAPKCWAFGPGLEEGRVRERGEFEVKLADKWGNELHRSTELVVLRVQHPSGSEVDGYINDHRNGSYSGWYHWQNEGTYSVSVWVNGAHISASPFKVPALGAFPPKCTASGLALEEAAVHSESTFSVDVRTEIDSKVRLFDQHNDMSTLLVGPVLSSLVPSSSLECAVHERPGPGGYDCSFTPKFEGDYQLSVKIKAEHIVGSPFALFVRPARPSRSWRRPARGSRAPRRPALRRFRARRPIPPGATIRPPSNPCRCRHRGPNRSCPLRPAAPAAQRA